MGIMVDSNNSAICITLPKRDFEAENFLDCGATLIGGQFLTGNPRLSILSFVGYHFNYLYNQTPRLVYNDTFRYTIVSLVVAKQNFHTVSLMSDEFKCRNALLK